MVVRLFEKYMQDMGYDILPTSYPQIKEYIREENGYLNTIQVIELKDEPVFDHDRFVEYTKDVSSMIKDKDIHVMTVVFCEDRHLADSMVSDEYMCWLIDSKDLCFVERACEEIQDFYGLKGMLTDWLKDTKALLESGDMHAISDKLLNNEERENLKEKNSKKPSPVAVTLVIINSIVFLTSAIIGNVAANGTNPFVSAGQMDPNGIIAGEYYRFLTAAFLHGGIQHLAGNMILLYFMGEMVEHNIGSVRFAIVYLLSGILGNVVSYTYEMVSGSRYVSVGASGAVYGIMGALLYLVIRKTKGLNIPIKRMVLVLAYCIYSSFATEHVDYAAHIGGLISGFLLTTVICELTKKKGGESESES
ncbi:MAG: rhomboid family intramembrane serine protease [Lachnospiraceae bacterium]|nr:rhomboid family intramembrane serine protease [Lachnospiraceae bacterium]